MERAAPIDSVQAETILAMLLSLQAGVLDEGNLAITKLIETEDEDDIGIVCQFDATIPNDSDIRSEFSLWI
jgi:hypothetical protein